MRNQLLYLIGIILLAMFFATHANAKGPGIMKDDTSIDADTDDVISPFLEYCAKDYSYSYCECMLKSYSDSMREEKKKRLQQVEKKGARSGVQYKRIKQIKEDLAEDDGILYPEAKRDLTRISLIPEEKIKNSDYAKFLDKILLFNDICR